MNTTNAMTNEVQLHELIRPDTISLVLKGKTKQEIIDELIDLMDGAGLLLDRFAVREAVIERERIVSTGLENGLAVPHGKTTGVDHLVGALGIKPDGIPFDAADGHPSKIFFMLITNILIIIDMLFCSLTEPSIWLTII